MKQLSKSKKGFVASATVDFYAYLTFILVIIIFAAMFLVMKGCEGGQNQVTADNILIEKAKADANYLVLNFLKTKHGNGNIADLIVSSIADNDYTILEQKIYDYFNLNYIGPTAKTGDDIYYWKITLRYPDPTETYGKGHKSFPDHGVRESSSQYIEPTDINKLLIQQIANEFLLSMALPSWQTVYLYDDKSWPIHNIIQHYYIPDSNGELINIWFVYSRMNAWSVFGR